MDQVQTDASRSARLPPDVDPIMEIENAAMSAATMFNRSLLASSAAYQKEWFGFLNRRWREDLDVPARLVCCQTLPEVQQVYLDFWKRAAEQYGVEFQHFAEIAQTKPQLAPEPTAPAAKANRAGRSCTSRPREPNDNDRG